MDPNSGQVYDLSDPTIPDDVRERLVPITEQAYHDMKDAIQSLQDEAKDIRQSDHASGPAVDVQKEANELGELLDEMDRVVNLPDPSEQFYPINRAARRKAEKRDRATRKRDPRG